MGLAKVQLKGLQSVSSELNRLQLQRAALQTARHAYANALKELIGEDSDEVLGEVGGTNSFEGLDDG
jgi:Arc/MetJ family transcription regulator